MKDVFLQIKILVRNARVQYNISSLFKTVDQLVHPTPPCVPAESDADDGERFSSYFIYTVESIRALVTPNGTLPTT